MKKAIMRINTLKDIEETKLRLWLRHEANEFYKLHLLINFRPNTSLRAINNQAKINLGA